MTTGTLQARLILRQAHSLKDKRRVLKGIKERLKGNFNVSVAEVADQDVWQSATLGFAAVGPDRKYIEGLLTQVVNFLRLQREAELVDHQMELF